MHVITVKLLKAVWILTEGMVCRMRTLLRLGDFLRRSFRLSARFLCGFPRRNSRISARSFLTH
jgi:hypothetical protein